MKGAISIEQLKMASAEPQQYCMQIYNLAGFMEPGYFVITQVRIRQMGNVPLVKKLHRKICSAVTVLVFTL